MNKFRVYNLRCLDRKNPQGIDQTPFFSWKLESKENDVYQSAYQICVTDEEKIVWNSGRVESDVNFGIVYEGEALKNGTSYRWTLVCWDNHGNESAKEEASFSTAMIQNKNWEAKWIGSTIEKKELREITDFQKIMRGEIDTSTEKQEILDSPVYFRKEFEIVKPVKKAILYATALGNYVIRLDGKKISNLLAPEYTCYGKHLEYQTYDLTEDLRNSEKHAFGILLSDGWYSGKIGLMGIGHQYGVENALLFQLELTYEDGTEEKIVSDDSVKFALGGYLYAEYYKQMRKKAQQVFSQTFADENGIMHQQLQGLYVAAIANGMLNETQEAGAVKQLCQLIHDAADCLDTGFLSIPFLLDTLWEKGEKELAYTLLFQKKAPSWLYAITQGATTIWENWAAILPNGIRTNSSYNHFAFGCVGDFIYRRIGGLQIEEAGYKKVRICPDLDNELSWAQTKYESIYGEIMIRWDKTEEGRKLQVQLPPNTSAVVEWNGERIEIKNGYSVFH